MKEFTKELVDKYAADLLIGLTAKENELVLEEFSIIKENMDQINEIADIANYKAMTHPIDLDEIILRDDLVKEELSLDCVLQNASYKTEEEIIVPKVVE